MSTIKVGDVVKLNQSLPDGDAGYFFLTVGKEYTVINSHYLLDEPMIYVKDDHGTIGGWFASRFTKVEREFKIGDVVEVIDACGDSLPLGLVNTIEKIYENSIYLSGAAGGYWNKSRFKLHTPMPSPAPKVKWAACPLDKDGNIELDPLLWIFAENEQDAIDWTKTMVSNHIKKTFAAVSFTIASAYRAEPVETKTVKYEVRKVR
jgi:hypothetical protein